MWKSRMAGGGGNKKRFQYCTDSSGQEILQLRALQGHSGRNPIVPSLQDNVLIPDNFFEYICHIGCAIHLHSITNSGLLPGEQNLGKKRQTVFFTAVNPVNKGTRRSVQDWLHRTTSCMVQAENVEKHQDTVYWVDIHLVQRKGLKSYQTRSNAIILYDTIPAYCIPKVVVMESGEIIFKIKYICHLECPPKISFDDNWMKELDSEVAGSSKDSHRIQPKSQTQLSRTERPVSVQPAGSFTQEIVKEWLVWSRRHQKLNKNGETCGWTTIQPELCASVCWTCRQRRRRRRKRRRRSNKNGETRERTIVVHSARGNRHWLQSARIVTCSCQRSRKLPRSRAREKDRKSFFIQKHFKPTCSRITSTTHSATIRNRWSVKWAM